MTKKTVAIVQSNYIPWRGYFDLINSVDEFILFDEVQYTRRDYRNRNKIIDATVGAWLTIPVKQKGKFSEKISSMVVAEGNWAKKHWKTLNARYSKAQGFRYYQDLFETTYSKAAELEYLSDINLLFIETINKILAIDTIISKSSDYGCIEGKNERLVDLCKKSNAGRYLSGPSALAYLDETLFTEAGLELSIFEYGRYCSYKQNSDKYIPNLSILDLIFNLGPDGKLIFNKKDGSD